jgi:hypothetical protein
MARLFTKPVHDDIEIELDSPETVDTENVDSQRSRTTENMTISAKAKSKLNASKKLTSTWLKLLSLPPQELVAELKVKKSFLLTLLISPYFKVDS